MFWLPIAILGSVAFLQTIRWTQHARANLVVVVAVNYQLVAIVYTAVLRPDLVPIDWPVLVLGATTGTIYICNIYLIAAVMRRVGIPLTTATMLLAVIQPVAVSIAFGDPWGGKAPGLAVALVALPMVALAGLHGDHSGTSRGLVFRAAWVLLLFVTIGLENTMFKVTREIGGQGYERLFLPALFIAAAFWATPIAVIRGAKPQLGDIGKGLTLGLCNIVANYSLAMAVMQLTGPVVFPLRLIGIVVGSAVLGHLLWQERLSRLGAAGTALSILAALLLGLSQWINPGA